MFKKISLYLILLLIIGGVMHFYQLDQGIVIIITQQRKISMHLVIAIAISILSIIVLHHMLKLIAAIKQTPKSWRNYRKQRAKDKHQALREKALLALLNDQLDQAENYFKQATNNSILNTEVDRLLMIYSAIQANQLAIAQKEIQSVNSHNQTMRNTLRYLQTKIYLRSNQAASAKSYIEQDRHFAKNAPIAQCYCECLMQTKQYHALLSFLTQRSSLSWENKQHWENQAHLQLIMQYTQSHQTKKAQAYYATLRYPQQQYPPIMQQYLHCLLISHNEKQFYQTIEKHLSALLNYADEQFTQLLATVQTKEAQNKLISLFSKRIEKPHFDDSDFTFICRAQLYTQQGKYKEAAQDYQQIINAKQNSKHSLHAQLAIAQLSVLHI